MKLVVAVVGELATGFTPLVCERSAHAHVIGAVPPLAEAVTDAVVAEPVPKVVPETSVGLMPTDIGGETLKMSLDVPVESSTSMR